MTTVKECPKCCQDVSDSWQDYDPDVGIMSAGWYCETCKLPIEHVPVDDDLEYE